MRYNFILKSHWINKTPDKGYQTAMMTTMVARMGMKLVWAGENDRWCMINYWYHKHDLCTTSTQKACLLHHDTDNRLTMIDRKISNISRYLSKCLTVRSIQCVWHGLCLVDSTNTCILAIAACKERLKFSNGLQQNFTNTMSLITTCATFCWILVMIIWIINLIFSFGSFEGQFSQSIYENCSSRGTFW